MANAAISISALGKRYRIAHQRDPYGRLTESLAAVARAPLDRIRGRGTTAEWFWALRDVTFDVEHGSVVGVIGQNGAGKSTLLKVLSRITEPTSGHVVIDGRVGSLLEVGTGFHPELTGRENVFLSGAVLGMRRAEINRKFDDIVDFAGIERFLDTPVKRYSSGMQVRLGFAVAAHLEPDILFVDEVLAVGDLAFQQKCLGKLDEVARSGRTVIFVSHNMGAIRSLCPISVWLDSGKVMKIGPTTEIVPEYVRSARGGLDSGEVSVDVDERRAAQVTRVRILGGQDQVTPIEEVSNPIKVEMVIIVRKRVPGMYAYLEIRDTAGQTIMMSDSLDTTPNPLDDLAIGTHTVTATIPARTLASGNYDVVLSLASATADEFTVHSPGVVASFQLDDSSSDRGNARPGFFSTLLLWNVASTEAGPSGNGGAEPH